MKKMSIEQYSALRTEILRPTLKYQIRYTSIVIIGTILLGVAAISAITILDKNFVNSTIFVLSNVIGSTMVFTGITLQRTLLNPNHKNCFAAFHHLKKLDQLYLAGKSAEEAAKELNLLPAE